MVQAETTTTDLLLHLMWRDFFNGKIPGEPEQQKKSNEMYRPDFSRPFPHRPGPTTDVFSGIGEMVSEATKGAKGRYYFLMGCEEDTQRTVVRLVSRWEDKLPAVKAAKEFTGVYNSVASQFTARTGIEWTPSSPHRGLIPQLYASATGPSIFGESDWKIYECTPESTKNSTRIVAAVELSKTLKQGLAAAMAKFMHGTNRLDALEGLLEEEGFNRAYSPIYPFGLHSFAFTHTIGTSIEFSRGYERVFEKDASSFQESEAKSLAERMRDAMMKSGIKGTLNLAAILNYDGMILIPELGSKKTLSGFRENIFYSCKTTDDGTIDNFGLHRSNN